MKFSAIPKNIPKTIFELNLSLNDLQEFEDDTLDECCANLKVLNLSHNKISNLKPRHFEKLKNLETLYLGSNGITNLDPNTFRMMTKLKRLDLSHNSIELQESDSKGFLVQGSIEELNLDHCNIEELPPNTFINMTQLKNLTLSGNPVDENWDLSAFEPLKNLLKLRIPNLSHAATYSLCDKLVSIDTINFDEFNISCYILANNQSFMEGIILNDPVEEPKIDSVMSPPLTTRKTTAAPSTTTSLMPPTELPTVPDTTTFIPQIQQIETSDATFANKTKLDTGSASIDIDNETLKFILVGESRCFTIKCDRYSSVA